MILLSSYLYNAPVKKNSVKYFNSIKAVFLICSISISLNAVAQITVTSNQTAAALTALLAGKGVTILNASLNCPDHANGIFKVVSSNLGLDSGIVLTTGSAASQGGFYGINGYSIELASRDNNYLGDTMLDTLSGQRTVDACSLEFDVIPNGDTINFNYVFSSEEYKNAVCGPYNDAFAFFISGPGINGHENIALIPGTNIPVTINSINSGTPGTLGNLNNCRAMGAGSPFTSYYIDNSTGRTLTHQGLTKVLQAIHSVTPCSIYHLKIVIADAGNPLYDSGVFLKAGSLETSNYSVSAMIPPTPVPTGAFCVKGCLPGKFQVKRTQTSSRAQTIKLITAGDAVSGIDYTPIPDSVTIPANDTMAEVAVNGLPTPPLGTKTIKLYVMSPNICTGANNITDSASMLIYDTIHISIATPDTLICGDDSVLIHVNGYDVLNYSWSPQTALNDPEIKDPIAFPSENTTYEVSAELQGSGCAAKTATITFNIRPTPTIKMNDDTTVCYNAQIQLSDLVTPRNIYYNYEWNGPNGFSSTQQEPTINNANSQNSGIYLFTVINDTNSCKAVATINVNVNVPAIPSVISPRIICLGTSDTALTAEGQHLLWYDAAGNSPGVSAPVPPTDQVADHYYYVSQTIDNCESPKAMIDVEVKRCCDGIINIPTAFTPNGDGLNDRFRPVEDLGYFIFSMHVFDRWGQLVYSGLHDGWDGNLGGKQMETGTYFYTITFGCILGGTVVKQGDVTLIR
jgi:gliding motility-associated-like protein